MKSVITVRKCLLLFFAIISALAVSGQNPPFKEITIGNQVWMDRNLNVTHFRNGDEITHARTAREWQQAAENGKPAWCFYNNDPKNEASYGRLYNWFAITDPRGFGPEGWRVPSDYDWGVLERYLGISMVQLEQFEWRGTDQGNKLRQEGSQFWRAPNAGANNQSGFAALPGGYRQPGGVFETMGVYGSWWTSTPFNDQNAYYRDLSAMHAGVYRGAFPKGCGFSVRLIKATGTGLQVLPDLTDERDGNVYKVVKIGSYVWMAENLRYLPQVHNDTEFAQTGKKSQPGYGVAGYGGSVLESAKSHENYQKYGVLYNWWAATGICPAGWHLPSDSEWAVLTDYLGGGNVAGNKMKSTIGWIDGGNGTNSSGFNGEPGGMRNDAGLSDRMGSFGYWWSSTEYTPQQSYARLLDHGDALAESRAWARRLSSREGEISRNHSSKVPGRSVRCIRNFESFYENHRHQRVDIEPDDELETALVPNLERPVRFVMEEPDSIIIPDSVFVMELPVQGFGPEGRPPGPSQEIGPGQQAGEQDAIIFPDSVFVIELPVQGIGPEGRPPGPSQEIGPGQQVGEQDAIIFPDSVFVIELPVQGIGPEGHPPGPSQDIGQGQVGEPDTEAIGQQVWMKRNLNVSTFRNGDPIPQALTLGEWIEFGNAGQPAWGYYDNDPANGELLGKLYNWYAVNDPRGLAPQGWRIPSKEDFELLISTAGGTYAYGPLKYGGSSGFDGLPGGWRNAHNYGAGYGRLGTYGYWWSSTEVDSYNAWYFGMYSSMELIYTLQDDKDHGFSVRCIKE